MNEKLEMFIAGFLTATAILTILYWAGQKDKEDWIAAQRYEDCVSEKYHTDSPARFIANYRIEHGFEPECLSK